MLNSTHKIQSMRLDKVKNIAGSLLLEVLLSVVILSVSVTLIIQSMTASLRAASFVSQYTIALNVLENKMAQLWANQSGGEGVESQEQIKEQNLQFQYDQTIDKSSIDASENLNSAEVKISWKSGKKTNLIAFKTYLYDSEQ